MTNKYNAMKMGELDNIISVSRKNKKLIPDNKHKFIIWNLPAIKTCPYATAHCKQFCYALKAERAYPNCKPARERNFKASMSADFVDMMVAYIHKACANKAYREAESVVVRIHESGDFYNMGYFEKWLAIANNCKDIPNVHFMAYTKSVAYVVGHTIPSNMTIRYSIWDDTNPEDIALAMGMGLPFYTAVDKFTTEAEENRCGCENCATCGKCWGAVKALMCEIH